MRDIGTSSTRATVRVAGWGMNPSIGHSGYGGGPGRLGRSSSPARGAPLVRRRFGPTEPTSALDPWSVWCADPGARAPATTATRAKPTTGRCAGVAGADQDGGTRAATLHEASPAGPAREVELGRSVAPGPRTATGAQGPPRRRVDGGAPPFERPASGPRALLLRAPNPGAARAHLEGAAPHP